MCRQPAWFSPLRTSTTDPCHHGHLCPLSIIMIVPKNPTLTAGGQWKYRWWQLRRLTHGLVNRPLLWVTTTMVQTKYTNGKSPQDHFWSGLPINICNKICRTNIEDSHRHHVQLCPHTLWNHAGLSKDWQGISQISNISNLQHLYPINITKHLRKEGMLIQLRSNF